MDPDRAASAEIFSDDYHQIETAASCSRVGTGCV